MSELDERRRRLLITALGSEGQAIVTATTTAYFTDAELSAAHVIELGPVAGARENRRPSLRQAAPGADMRVRPRVSRRRVRSRMGLRRRPRRMVRGVEEWEIL